MHKERHSLREEKTLTCTRRDSTALIMTIFDENPIGMDPGGREGEGGGGGWGGGGRGGGRESPC